MNDVLNLPAKIPLFTSYTDVYYHNRDSEKFITVNQGGTSSSKTYSILQVLCKLAIEKKRIIQVFGQDFPNLYVGAITDFKRLITDSEVLRACLQNPNLDRGPFKFKNGSVIQFTTAQTFQDAKSGKRDILFINEANGISYEVAFELIARTAERVFIDYNPNARFWVHYELEGKPEVEFIISNFTHNQFIPQQSKNQILSWKTEYERTQSLYWKNKWLVYGLGLTGAVEGTVFDHVNLCSFFPTAITNYKYGLDFGFKNNFTALVKIGYYNNAMYGKEILYEQQLNSVHLAERLEEIGISKKDQIIADPANSEAITILQEKGFNIVPAKKGPDSIKAGIELIQSLPLYLTKDSKNWLVELENYKYKKDTNGKFTNNPIDSYNDCFVAGSMVTTSTGQKPIEQIEVGELVLTSGGYNRVVHTWDNGVREVSKYTLTFDDREIVITCTDKHKIKTDKGWKQIQDLQEQDIVYLSKDSTEKFSNYTQIKNISIGTVSRCIEWYGNIIMDLFLKGFMYTTLMRIPTTMILAILCWWKRENTCRITPKRGLKSILISFKKQVQKRRKLGTKVKRVISGIKNTLQRQVSVPRLMDSKTAISVGLSTKLKIQPTTSVPTTVNHKHEETRGLIMKQEFAKSAEKTTLPTNTENKGFVQKAVLTKIERKYVGPRRVYDLMVEHNHEYLIHNLLVSNCFDAARYVYTEFFGLRLKKPNQRVSRPYARKIYTA